MHTILLNAHEGTPELGPSKPLLYPLLRENRLYVQQIQEFDRVNLQAAYQRVRTFLDQEEVVGRWQIIVLLPLYEELENPYASSISARMKILREAFLEQDYFVHEHRPDNVFLLFLDDVNHDIDYINESERNYNLAYRIDLNGMLWSSNALIGANDEGYWEQFQIFEESQFEHHDNIWKNDILEQLSRTEYSSGQKIFLNMPFDLQPNGLKKSVSEQIDKILESFDEHVIGKIHHLLGSDNHHLQIDKSDSTLIDQKLLEDIKKLFEQKLHESKKNLDSYKNFSCLNILKDTIQSYIGLGAIPNQDRFVMLRFPFLGGRSNYQENLFKLNTLIYLLAENSNTICAEFQRNKSYTVNLQINKKNLFQILSLYTETVEHEISQSRKRLNEEEHSEIELYNETIIEEMITPNSLNEVSQAKVNEHLYNEILDLNIEDIEGFRQHKSKWFEKVLTYYSKLHKEVNSKLGDELQKMHNREFVKNTYPRGGSNPVKSLLDRKFDELNELQRKIKEKNKEISFRQEGKKFREDSEKELDGIFKLRLLNSKKWALLVWVVVPSLVFIALIPDLSGQNLIGKIIGVFAYGLLSLALTWWLVSGARKHVQTKIKQNLQRIAEDAMEIERNIRKAIPDQFRQSKDQLLVRVKKYNYKILSEEYDKEVDRVAKINFHLGKLDEHKISAENLVKIITNPEDREELPYLERGENGYSKNNEFQMLEIQKPVIPNLLYSYGNAESKIPSSEKEIAIGTRNFLINSRINRYINFLSFKEDEIYQFQNLYR